MAGDTNEGADRGLHRLQSFRAHARGQQMGEQLGEALRVLAEQVELVLHVPARTRPHKNDATRAKELGTGAGPIRGLRQKRRYGWWCTRQVEEKDTRHTFSWCGAALPTF